MSSPPSRSEIEAALSAKRARAHANRKQKSAKKSTKLALKNQRPQKTLGGDLSGVSARRRGSIMTNGLRSLSIANWIAAAITLLILSAFFWPADNQKSVREVTSLNKQNEIEPFYTQARVDEPEQSTKETEDFARNTDLTRAAEYREQEANERKVSELLDRAARHLARGEYTEPAQSNAIAAYQQVLSLKPNDASAREGINYIKGRFLNTAYADLEKGDPDSAILSLDKLRHIDPQSAETTELDQAIKAWQIQKQIYPLLVKAAAAERQNKLVLPAADNALHHYREALKFDPDDSNARAGVKRIADIFAERATKAYSEGEFEAANGYLATLSVIDPQHASIEKINTQINNAQSKAKKAAANKLRNKRSSNRQLASKKVSEIDTTPKQKATTQQITRQNVSQRRTPSQQASEQAAIDRQYLARGLQAYYQGEYSKAASLLQPLADKGISRAQFRIAYMHYLGRGFRKNSAEADRIIRAALPAVQKFANEGRSWAQSDLGSLYEDGLVLPRNYSEAIYWYRTAAEQGYPGAQTNLGIMYAQGRGVTQSRKTAIKWFQKAAKQGDIAAQRNLQTIGKN